MKKNALLKYCPQPNQVGTQDVRREGQQCLLGSAEHPHGFVYLVQQVLCGSLGGGWWARVEDV